MDSLIGLLKVLLYLWIASFSIGLVASLVIYGTMLYKYFKDFK